MTDSLDFVSFPPSNRSIRKIHALTEMEHVARRPLEKFHLLGKRGSSRPLWNSMNGTTRPSTRESRIPDNRFLLAKRRETARDFRKRIIPKFRPIFQANGQLASVLCRGYATEGHRDKTSETGETPL